MKRDGVGIPRVYGRLDQFCDDGHDTYVVGRFTSGACCECQRVTQSEHQKKWIRRRTEKDKELEKYISPLPPTQEMRTNAVTELILENSKRLEQCMPWEKTAIKTRIKALQDLM